MKTDIVIQDAIATMGVALTIKRPDITGLEFRLSPDIFLNDCYLDGKSYEINFGSSLRDGWRYYKLPVFLSSVELHYDAKLTRDRYGNMVLLDEDGWLPVWPAAHSLREFKLRLPDDMMLITNYQRQDGPAFAGGQTIHLIGQGPCLIVLGKFQRLVHYSHQYFLSNRIDVELFDKFLRETKRSLEADWGKPTAWPERFVEVDRDLGHLGVIAVSRNELLDFGRMSDVLTRIVMTAYPVEFGDYFKLFREPFYRYLSWRALKGVMSATEQLARLPKRQAGQGPLIERMDPGADGVLFFKALEDLVGARVFQDRGTDIMTQFRKTPLSLVHFINLFGQEEATRQFLERWLFMGQG